MQRPVGAELMGVIPLSAHTEEEGIGGAAGQYCCRLSVMEPGLKAGEAQAHLPGMNSHCRGPWTLI